MSKFKLTLMIGKPIFKKVAKAVSKSRKDTRDYRKTQAAKSSKELATLNQAQERLETAKNVKSVSETILKKRKFPKEAISAFNDAFDRVIKKRTKTRTTLMDPKYLKAKKNKSGGIIKAKKGKFI